MTPESALDDEALARGEVAPRRTRLQRLRWPLMALAPIAVLAGAVGYYVFGGRYESTDDAYTQAASVSVSSNIAGRVVEVVVHDNEFVHRGDPLIRLDDRPYRIAVSEAAARLASATLQIESLKSTYRQRETDLRSTRETLAYEQSEYDRHKRLLSSGIVSRAQYDQAQHALDTARQQVASAEQQVAAVAADLDDNPAIDPKDHPSVQQAQAALDRAKLDLSYTVIVASTDGVVTKVDQLQVGDYINASTPLFALVKSQDAWVEANFKEVQLAHMRVGQTVTVKIDRYPGKRFSATVASMSPSTGSQFSMLPPENATGNWVKVVQRVPVRLRLDADPDYPLQAGLSAEVSVDTQSRANQGPAEPAGGPLMGSASR